MGLWGRGLKVYGDLVIILDPNHFKEGLRYYTTVGSGWPPTGFPYFRKTLFLVVPAR